VADSTDVILQLSDKQWSSAVRARDRAAALANVFVLAAAVLQAAIVLTGYDATSMPAAVLICVLGVYGGLACWRYARRFHRDMQRFDKLARRLDELAPDAGLVALEKGPLEDRGLGFSPAWVLHAGLVILGLVNVGLIIVH
jgi:hypothetical protein